jgi:hypothetical protein
MKRALAGALSGLILVVLFPAAARADLPDRALEASARGSVIAGIAGVEPNFDPALIDSLSTSSNLGTSSISSVVWPSWLVDAFFFLYGFQPVERLALGIAEARWPHEPGEADEADGTLSDLLFLNAGDPDALPGKGGKSLARAVEGRASGDVAASAFALPGGITVGTATSSTEVRTENNNSFAAGRQAMFDVVAGPLHIESIRGGATTRSGAAATVADATLVVAGATVAGIPVVIGEASVRALNEATQGQVDQILRSAGIDAHLVPSSEHSSSEASSASSGGVEMRVHQVAADPTGEPRDVTLGYIFGSATAATRATVLEQFPPFRPATFRTVSPPTTRTILAPRAMANVAPAPSPVTRIHRRTIITAAVTVPTDGARTAYGAIMFFAVCLLAVRPVLRALARA